MKPNQLTTLRVEDYPSEQRAWLPRLFQPLNQVLTTTYNILNGRVEFGSNIPAVDQVLRFTYSGTSQSFMWSLLNAPAILVVGQATQDGIAVGLQIFWQYNSSTKKVSVDFFTLSGESLTVGSAYIVFLRALP